MKACINVSVLARERNGRTLAMFLRW
uniref:Uncharacterized protein n=1 Tax=Anguilla anguilla TaxID=7936 RepID=A0A0E9XUD5_ANGAN